MKKLRELAVRASYQAIISEFNAIFLKKNGIGRDGEGAETEGRDHPAEKKAKEKEEESNEEDYLLNQEERNKALKELKKKLDYYLIGPFIVERQQFVNRFIKSHSNHSASYVDQNLCLAFFNCLLNSDTTHFNLTGGEDDHHPFHEVIDPLKLLPIIISQRCTNLKSLSLSFGVPGRVKVPLVPAICDILKRFKHLTDLAISWEATAGTDFLPFFAALGDTCPKLTTLDLGFGIPFEFNHLLALVLGRKRQLLPQYLLSQLRTSGPSLANLQFSAQSVTPICSALQQLKVGRYFLASHTGVFILRHFPKLQTCQSTTSFAQAVLNLHKTTQQQQMNGSPSSSTSPVQTSSDGELGVIQWTVNSPFQGQLNLVAIGYLNFYSRKAVRAIGAICPNLRAVHFGGVHSTFTDDLLEPDQLRSLLSSPDFSSCWSNITSISMDRVSSDYRRVILDCLGGRQLRKLSFSGCTDINPVSELLPFNKLETLLLCSCTLAGLDDEARTLVHRVRHDDVLADSGFLPKLKCLTTRQTCLFEWSRLFKCHHRPSLTELDLACYHVGLPSASQINWSDTPIFWPNLRRLKFSDFDGYRNIESITPHLNRFYRLEELVVPRFDAFFSLEDISCFLPAGLLIFHNGGIGYYGNHHCLLQLEN